MTMNTTRTRAQVRRVPRYLAKVLALTLTFVGSTAASGQTIPATHGQGVVPVFDGWMENSDGTFDMILGYMNLNTEEVVDIPIGPDNNIEPGGPDYAQPTHFFTRRNLYVFRVRVPRDFGQKELVWTLKANGKTARAYATLKPDYVIDNRTMMANIGAFGGLGQRLGHPENIGPTVRVQGETHRTVKVGQPLTLTAFASDDGYPYGGLGGAIDIGLVVNWYVYRGTGKVAFDPEQSDPALTALRSRERGSGSSAIRPESSRTRSPTLIPVVDRMGSVKVTFSEPGTYILQVMAHDGGLGASQSVTVNVRPTDGSR
jgi:hypothetical protein